MEKGCIFDSTRNRIINFKTDIMKMKKFGTQKFILCVFDLASLRHYYYNPNENGRVVIDSLKATPFMLQEVPRVLAECEGYAAYELCELD